jgi:hypothetical protein
VSSSNLTRVGGLAAVLGGLLIIFVLIPIYIMNETSAWVNVTWIPTLVFLAMGIVGLRTRQEGALGWLGNTGFFLAVIGTGLFTVVSLGNVFYEWPLQTTPPELVQAIEGMVVLLMMAGTLLLGIATTKAGVLPRWSGLALVIGTMSALILGFIGSENVRLQEAGVLLFGVGWTVLGFAHRSGKGETLHKPSRVP